MDERPTRPPSPSLRITLWVFAAIIGFGTWTQVSQLRAIESRLHRLVGTTSDDEIHRVALQESLAMMESKLLGLESGLAEVAVETGGNTQTLAVRLQETEGQLGRIGSAVEAHASSLQSLEEAQSSFVAPHTLQAELEERDTRLLSRWETLSELVDDARATAEESVRLVGSLDEEIHAPRDLRVMWRDLVGPVVQLAGDTSVGSGVLLRSRFDETSQSHRTHLITAWHVVRDIQGNLSNTDMLVPVTIYAEDGSISSEEATLLCFDAQLDAALLEIETVEPLANGARIPRRSSLDKVRIFEEVYAVGCPLGNDPIPTRGEISTSHHIIGNETYWMINAPTYIGNSGGGIFHGETHELLGIFSKIYTHGTVRPTIIPHMGLVTPLAEIYDWLATEGYDVVESAPDSGDVCIAAAPKEVAHD